MSLKKYLAAFLLLSVISGCPNLYAASSAQPETFPASDRSKEPPVENLISLEYPKLVLDDTWHVLSSPTRWDQKEWLWAGLGTGTVIVVGALADKPIEKEFAKHRTRGNDNFSKNVERFGAEYSFITLAAYELEGLALRDNRSLAVAQDGLASSVVAAGVITPSLKWIVGRSRPSSDKGPHDFNPFSSSASFPSGHATQAFAVASVIAEHYDSPWVKIGSYGLASAVAYARMEQKAHWASDVLVGAIIGTVVGRTIVHFNHDKRYELSPIIDGNTVGVKATHTF